MFHIKMAGRKMTEIWNLSALCRCCHIDGEFKSLNHSYFVENEVEIYSDMLRDTFGVIIDPPKPKSDISYAICDMCIKELRRAVRFKKQVLVCEDKFEEYCKNEEVIKLPNEIKEELESVHDNSDGEIDYYNNYDGSYDVKATPSFVKDEFKLNTEDGKGHVKQEEKKTCQTIAMVNVETDKNKPKKRKKTISDKKTLKYRTFITPEQEEACSKYIVMNRNDNTFSCRECGTNFKKSYVIKRHVLHTHLKIPFKCMQCNQEFKTRTEKMLHTATHNPKYPHTCTVCGKIYPTKHSFTRHMNSHTKEVLYQCDDCKKEFLHKKTLLNHIKVYHLGLPKPQVICYVCGHSFNDITNMRKHITTVHEKRKPYGCDLCSRNFSAKKHLVEHVRRVHTFERPYSCDKCGSNFVSSADMIRHKSSHCYKSTTFTCKLCSSTFSNRGDLLRHSRSHSGSKPLLCHLCQKDFSCKYALSRHIQKHSGIKLHQCDVCLKRFSQKESMKRHKKLHSAKLVVEKKHKCDICKKFVADLVKHVENHNNKPYGCEYCPKRYPERNSLNRHVANIHFGRKAHACNLCDQKYVHPRSLRNHKLKVHKIAAKVEKEEVLEQLPAYVPDKNGLSSIDVNIDVAN